MTDGARVHSKMSLIALNKDFDVKPLVFFNSPNYAVNITNMGVMRVIQDKTDELGSVLPFLFSNDCIGYNLGSINLLHSVLQSILTIKRIYTLILCISRGYFVFVILIFL